MQLFRLSGETRTVKLTLLAVLLVYVALAVNEIDWGAPKLWHPDEKQDKAVSLIWKRTVNPGHFAYGGMYYYMYALGAGVPALAYGKIFDPRPVEVGELRDEWQYRQQVRVVVAGRLLTVLLGTGVILITFSLGRALFSSQVGVVAAATLAVSPYFVAISHFAIVDMAANFWYWLAMLVAVGIYRGGGRGWYVASGLLLGLATGVKIDRLLGALPLLVAHFLRREGLGVGRIALLAATGLAGYLFSNLVIFTEPFLFLQGTLRDLFFNMMREADYITPYTTLLGFIADGMGLPLLTLAAVGFLMLLRSVVAGRHGSEMLWLLATVVPAFWVFGAGVSTPWYSPFFFPALAILVGFAVWWLVERLGRPAVALAAVALAAALGWALLQALTFNHGLGTDARYRAASWLTEHAAPGSVVEFGPRAPNLDPGRFQLVKRWRDPKERTTFMAWRGRLENHEPYQRIRAALTELEARISDLLGTDPTPEYGAWFDFDKTPRPEPTEQVEYKVMVLPLEEKQSKAVAAPGSGYRLVASFDPEPFFGRISGFPFINPRVVIFRHDKDD
jgi:hypothetical protein